MQQQFRIVRVPRWQIALLAAGVFAFVVALFVVAFGVFLLALPVFIVAGALAYLFGGGRYKRPGREADNRIIDVEYRVIQEKPMDRHGER